MKVVSASTMVAVACLFSVAPSTVRTMAQAPASPAAAAQPAGFTIGPADILAVTFWREPDMSVAEVVVRPDGKISLPLIHDVVAAGLTPEQLRASIAEAAKKFVADPNVSVVVTTINSRNASITGLVTTPGSYALGNRTTVIDLIARAGGLQEYAKKKEIVVIRGATPMPFNYEDVSKGKNLNQNVELRPGDAVIVP